MRKIIVVEDELIIALDIKGVLEKNGYEAIIGIKSIKEALNAIEEFNPLLVIIDINLGNYNDGTEIGDFLLKKDTIPYIYLTSYSDKLTLDKVNKTRPHGYLVKPFKDEDLIATISIILNNFYHRNIDAKRNIIEQKKIIPYRLKDVILYINNNIDKKIEIEELTIITKWKKHYFNKVFFEYLNVTPYQYILQKKMEKAKTLLSETEIPVNEIAFELSFQSYSNFCNAFKKAYRITPVNYRKITQENNS